MQDDFYKDHKELHAAFIEALKNEPATLIKHAKRIGITQHTLINFLNGTHVPSRIVSVKIVEYIYKINKKKVIEDKRKEELHKRKIIQPVATKSIYENMRNELLEVFVTFKRSYTEWSEDIGITPEQFIGFIVNPEDCGNFVIDKVKNYLYGIKTVNQMIEKIESHQGWDE